MCKGLEYSKGVCGGRLDDLQLKLVMAGKPPEERTALLTLLTALPSRSDEPQGNGLVGHRKLAALHKSLNMAPTSRLSKLSSGGQPLLYFPRLPVLCKFGSQHS